MISATVSSAQTAGDLLLDEQPDHLALLGGLDLLGDDHLHGGRRVRGGLPAGLERAGDLVVVGHRDRAQALLARGGQQHLHGCGAIAGVVGVHVQVDVDQRSLRKAPVQRRIAAEAMSVRRYAAVDLLQRIGGTAASASSSSSL